MEATALLRLHLILFLSFTTNGVSARLSISIVNNQPSAVFDSNGDELLPGNTYYILPSIRFPVKFSPIRPNNDEIITVSTDLNIKFGSEPSSICRGSTVLEVMSEERDKFLSLGGGGSQNHSSGDVGISTRFDGSKRLVLTRDNPLSFQFEVVRNLPSARK
ncbi:hypothetical protein TIFTF001_010220 [Ficus carica]|uniref:Uncharacterized protein n=1 Tax=Ficus carica TaxID=3494 RepID=A0AA88A8B4_FICCA|nr:hypothetical protein TIFTF001_010220 [Ficus carica]